MERRKKPSSNVDATAIRARNVTVTRAKIVVKAKTSGSNTPNPPSAVANASVAFAIVFLAFSIAYWKPFHPNSDKAENDPQSAKTGLQNPNNTPKDDGPVKSEESSKGETPASPNVKERKEVNPSWEAVARVLAATTPLSPETVNYGGHKFVCEARSPYFRKFHLRWKGKCTDEKTGIIAVSKGCKSPTTSVERAAAQLIRDMVSRKEYPEPSETKRMPTECDC